MDDVDLSIPILCCTLNINRFRYTALPFLVAAVLGSPTTPKRCILYGVSLRCFLFYVSSNCMERGG